MKPFYGTPEVLAAYNEAKCLAVRFVTNFFPDPCKIEKWVVHNSLFEANRGRSAVILRKDTDFFHVLFAAAELEALTISLKNVPSNQVCVCDLLGLPAEVAELADCFEKAGFRRYKTLQRLIRINNPTLRFSPDPNVVNATTDDALCIFNKLHESFDRYAEQIPPLDELVKAAEQERILIIHKGDELVGFLYFEHQGQTSLIRYWFVSDVCRGKGVGSKLMKTFFHRCSDAKRTLLWVIATNEIVIAKYVNYGFLLDVLIDQVMIKEVAK